MLDSFTQLDNVDRVIFQTILYRFQCFSTLLSNLRSLQEDSNTRLQPLNDHIKSCRDEKLLLDESSIAESVARAEKLEAKEKIYLLDPGKDGLLIVGVKGALQLLLSVPTRLQLFQQLLRVAE